MTLCCILAAGTGSRLKKPLHKCLLPVNGCAVISHIIDNTPKNTEFVVAIGYQGQLVKEYCLAAHPARKFTFVEIDVYEGPGSGPGYSLSCCQDRLQQPFYLVCGDCIVLEKLPPLNANWIGLHPVTNTSQWSTALVEDGKVVKFMNKSAEGYPFAWIGLAGIKDYQTFWQQLHGPEVVSAFQNPQVYPLLGKNFTWYDTGTPENYAATCVGLGMAKEIGESTYHIENRCVKVFVDSEVCKNRIQRASILPVPPILYRGNHVYAYEWVEGKTLYELNNFDLFVQFLKWCEKSLWIHGGELGDACNKFYHDKTYKRLQMYYDKGNIEAINLEKVDWERLYRGVPCQIHGDLQLENVLYGDKFYLIDWRDSFGGLLNCGDIYYDFAKLYASLSMSYQHIKEGNFWFQDGHYSFTVTPELTEMKVYFENWLLRKGYDLYKVRLLCALVYLNMAPLHTTPFDKLLFHHARDLITTLSC